MRELSAIRLEAVRLFLMRLGDRQMIQVSDLLSSDVRYRVTGQHAVSGTFVGRDEVISHLMELVARTNGTFSPIKLRDWMLGESHISVLAEVHVQVPRRIYAGDRIYVLEFDEANLISEVRVYFADDQAMVWLLGPLDTRGERSVFSCTGVHRPLCRRHCLRGIGFGPTGWGSSWVG